MDLNPPPLRCIALSGITPALGVSGVLEEGEGTNKEKHAFNIYEDQPPYPTEGAIACTLSLGYITICELALEYWVAEFLGSGSGAENVSSKY